jgi:coatomer subunit beta
VHLLMDFLGDSNVASALDVVFFVREITETNPKLRESIMFRLLDTFNQIRSSRVCTCALWIIGEYSVSLQEIENGIAVIKQSLGDMPFYSAAEESEASIAGDNKASVNKGPAPINVSSASSKRPAVLADGTYATQSAVAENAGPLSVSTATSNPAANLRAILLTGDFFLGAVVSATLTKLVMRMEEAQPSVVALNKTKAEVLLILVSMLRLGESSVLPHPIDKDSYDRISLCIRLLSSPDDVIRTVWLKYCHDSFVVMLKEKQDRENEDLKAKAMVSYAQPDDLIDFYHLKSRKVRNICRSQF